MTLAPDLSHFLASVHPYDSLPRADFEALCTRCHLEKYPAGATVFATGDRMPGLFVMVSGEVEVTDEADVQLSILGPRNSFGERALLRREAASRTVRANVPTDVLRIPRGVFYALLDAHEPVRKFFDRRRPRRDQRPDLSTLRVDQMMTRKPVTCPPSTPISDAASEMIAQRISSICVIEAGQFVGIVTLRDLTERVIVGGHAAKRPISEIMTRNPVELPPRTLVMDVLHLMVENRIGHVPVVDGETLVGIVTKTDLTKAQALSSSDIVRHASEARDVPGLARATSEIPQVLLHLVDSGNRHETVTRLVTDIADTVTRRLLSLAKAKLGPAPVPYLWLACGSQGRQEQTGVSDQDNCLILDDDVRPEHMGYFEELARFVSDGLHQCGYVYCPGDMMATNPQWCQPLSVWRDYFRGWITKPNPKAQMLASVMFDLRPIGGDHGLFDGLQTEVLEAASRNSIFAAHMVANSLKHSPPLGLLRGLATIRSGEHRDELDLKHKGVVPIVDLGRIYALTGELRVVNTRARIEAAIAQGLVSEAGGADLMDAYDHIATTRLLHQTQQIRDGNAPTNYLDPSDLSDFERSHLRDAFVVVKTMQAAAASGKGALG